MLHRLHALALALMLAVSPFVAVHASQNPLFSPTTGTVSGLALSNNYNSAIDALNTCNSGTGAPANQLSGGPALGNCWIDTSSAPNAVKRHDGNGHWTVTGWIDPTNGIFVPILGGGSSTVSSATTTDIGASPQTLITISGTTTITSLGSSSPQPGLRKTLLFSGALTLTYNATSLVLPGAANITTVAGDVADAIYLGGGNWRVLTYTRADGTAVSFNSNFNGAVFFDARIAPAALASNTNNWNPTGLSTANVIQFSCSSAINVTGLVAPAIDGQVIVLDNIGATNTCTVTAQDTNSTAANRFAFDRPIAVRPGRSITVKYDITAARWRLIQEITAQPVAGGFKNLRVFNVATALGDSAPATANNQISVAADEITLEDATGGAVRASGVAVTADVTVAGANGLDTGSVSVSQWYTEWVIYNPTTNTIAGLLSTSATAPTMPSGYTFKARVGWNRTDASSHFFRVVQYGRRAQYVIVAATNTSAVIPITAAGTAGVISPTTPTWASVSVSAVVPSTASRISVLATGIYNAGTAASVFVAPNNSYAGRASQAPPPIVVDNASVASFVVEFALESSNIFWASGASGGFIGVIGWEDNI